jgi:hypothetical protein
MFVVNLPWFLKLYGIHFLGLLHFEWVEKRH